MVRNRARSAARGARRLRRGRAPVLGARLRVYPTQAAAAVNLSYVLYKISIQHERRRRAVLQSAMPAAMAQRPPAPTAADAAAGARPAFSPLYQQIKALILQSLQAGEWKPGEAIPSEMDLAARFRVSQGTVRKAIDELAAENLVVRRQGKGTFVATHAEQQSSTASCKLDARQRRRRQRRPGRAHVARLQAPARPRRRRARARPAHRRRGGAGAPRAARSAARRPSSRTSGCPAAPFKGLTAERLADYHGPDVRACSKPNSACAWCAPRKRSARSRPTPPQAALLAVDRRHAAAERRARGLHLQRHADGAAPRPLPHRHAPLSQRTELKRVTPHRPRSRNASEHSAWCVAIEFWVVRISPKNT